MAYDFAGLSPADFEDLVRDLISRELGVRFGAFAVGPDGGMDGRHAMAGEAIILQAKHYAASTYAALKSAMRRERASIDRLSPTRYILATSRALSHGNKHELATIIGPSLTSEADIFGARDLNGLLRKFPDIEKAHIKLWLTGATVLEWVFRSAAHAFNNITRAEIEAKVGVYAPNPSLNQSRDILESHHVIIISGPPGVGKTTLGEMLSYAYSAEGWELVAIRSLDDGFASIDDTKKQIFFFDDFLGKVSLDHRALSQKDSDLARFIKRVRSSPNARFILTTRAYIFEEARRVSEHLSDHRLDISKYVLDVGIYTRRIKARILYNHLLIAKTPQTYINALVQSGHIADIIDHRNYNPRIIEWMTDVAHIASLDPEAYAAAFLNALTHPTRLWDTAFRTHISKACQHLLLALFFCSERGITIEKLRVAYESLHRDLCMEYGEAHDPKDFEEALRILEGGFISLRGKYVNFVNPSLRDYLTEYLEDRALLRTCAASSRQPTWAQAVWQHGKRLNLSGDSLKSFTLSFLPVADELIRAPTWERTQDGSKYMLYPVGPSNTDRIQLLVEWWGATQEARFAELALALARSPVDGLDAYRDGEEGMELIRRLRDDYFDEVPRADEIADALEDAVITMITKGVPSDDLVKIADAFDSWPTAFGDGVKQSLYDATRIEFEQISSTVADIDSESTLQDHIEALQKLGHRAAIASATIDTAVKMAMERMAEIEEEAAGSRSPSFSAAESADADIFDDVALRNLFASLVVSNSPEP